MLTIFILKSKSGEVEKHAITTFRSHFDDGEYICFKRALLYRKI